MFISKLTRSKMAAPLAGAAAYPSPFIESGARTNKHHFPDEKSANFSPAPSAPENTPIYLYFHFLLRF